MSAAQPLRLAFPAGSVRPMSKSDKTLDPVELLWRRGVAAAREAMGLQQVELAERIGCSRRMLQYYETMAAREVPLMVKLAIAARIRNPDLPDK